MEDEQKSQLIKQGAEAKVYITTLFTKPQLLSPITGQSSVPVKTSSRSDKVLLKYRFPKTYRHPTLSTQLTASRTTAEARALIRCARVGVNTPKIVCVDEEQGVLGLEIVDGYSVRELLGGGSEGEDEYEEEEEVQPSNQIASEELILLTNEEGLVIMRKIGIQLARMHQAHIIHGDLTTSNMMVRRQKGAASIQSAEVVLIDFGLSLNSTSAEDKAVDLYVLQRAFASTHPDSEHLFDEILKAYQDIIENKPVLYDPKVKAEKGTVAGPTHWKEIKRKLDDVRLRGRKRSMVG
ncbi:kinase-like protein [Meira miltonrushii]|uniref:non-specific serine/threonine protein kinase n=1 Tax=Meira miltonrushii TaxID=1280837 RepID=A0A316VEM5_9BASI|nr:kinase-like protein [Meira miltonrushii]PWN36107.1 kinase-like protein [Meira miltonrushii]